MPKNVVCKKCNNLVNDWCEKVIDSPDPDMQRDCQYFCEKTNADCIRAMSDEELAAKIEELAAKISRRCIRTLCDIVCGEDCKAFETLNKTSQQRYVEIVLDWLKQPAE